MLVALILSIAVVFIALERLWPANKLPTVRAWYPRVLLINAAQGAIVLIAGMTWDVWLRQTSIVRLQDHIDGRAGASHRGVIHRTIAIDRGVAGGEQ